MRPSSPIRNLAALDKEIDRLQAEAAAKEKQMLEKAEWLRHNAKRIVMDELFCKKQGKHAGFNESNFKSERWKAFFDRMVDQFADRAADGVENFLDKLFHKKKHH